MITKSTGHKISSSWISISKQVIIMVLIFIEFTNLYLAYEQQNFLVYFMTPVILIITYLFVLFINTYELVNGWRNSSLIFIFWAFLCLNSTLIARSKVQYDLNKADTTAIYGYELSTTEISLNKLKRPDIILFYIYYILVVISVLLSILSYDYDDEDDLDNKLPENTCSLLARLTFYWTGTLINIGFKRDLTRDDLWSVDEKLKSKSACNRLEYEWNASANDYINKMRKISANDEPLNDSYSYKSKFEGEEEHLNVNIEDSKNKKARKKFPSPSLGYCLLKIVLGKFIGILALKICHDLLNFVRPLLLDKLISFVNDKEQRISVGFFFIFILCLSSIVQTLISQHYYHGVFIIGNRLKLGLQNIIYKKSLRLSASARRNTNVGNMTNLLTTNATTFEYCCYQFVGLISAPFQIAICTFLLYQKIGVATFVGMTTMIIFMPLNLYLARIGKKIRKEKYKIQDSRIKIMNEILAGIRVIKFYGWELSFQKLVKNLRVKEMKKLLKSAILSTVTSLTWACVPFIVACVSFAVYLAMNENNNLDPNTAFVSLTLFNMLRFPLNFLPYIIQGLININVSLTRIRQFLLEDEINEDDVTHFKKSDSVINIENVSFGWNWETKFLKDIRVKIQEKKLISVVGRVGSGKSSLISAILGDMHKLSSGELNVHGSIAYVPQQAWIQNASVRDNVLFNTPFVEDFYKDVISSCSLAVDLNIMPDGDRTEIGEKGINLSGGQKQRISLARSVYSDADIYLLDDPLSAVDSHVGKSIFDKIIGPEGLLKNKTRLFVTNSLNFLPQSDEIIMIQDGMIVQMGTYEELSSQKGPFSDFTRNYLMTNEKHQAEKN